MEEQNDFSHPTKASVGISTKHIRGTKGCNPVLAHHFSLHTFEGEVLVNSKPECVSKDLTSYASRSTIGVSEPSKYCGNNLAEADYGTAGRIYSALPVTH